MNLFGRKPGGWEALRRLDKYQLGANFSTRLAQFLRETDERDLVLGNPAQLAAALKLDTPQTLRLIALAAHEGVFQVLWLARCPHCGSLDQSGGHSHLADYTDEPVTCKACQGTFLIHADHTLNVQYRPHPSLRSLPAQVADWEHQGALVKQWGLTPAWAMLNLEEFRTYLAELNLPPGQSIGVRVQTFWFTDIRSSTAMYEQLGDARAYELVRQHYEIIFRAAQARGGYAVKTIGDGTLGNFTRPVEALAAAVEAVRGVAALKAGSERPLRLRVGLHTGPCIVVALNGRLDFFGTTVNTASRIEAQSTGEDVVLSEAILHDPEVKQLAETTGPLEAFSVNLRGLAEAQTLYRLKLL
jgi:class 3 adenylate cyclase